MRFVVPFARGLAKTMLKARQNVVKRCEVLSSLANEADVMRRPRAQKMRGTRA